MSGLRRALRDCPDSRHPGHVGAPRSARSATSLTTRRGDRARRLRSCTSLTAPLARPRAAPQRRTLAPLLWSGRGADGARRGHARRADRRRRPGAGRRCRWRRPGRLRLDPVHVPDRPAARPRGARRRARRAAACGSARRPGTDGLRGLLADALGDPLAAAPVLGRGLLGPRATAARDAAGRRRPPARVDAGRARGPARRRDRPRRAACAEPEVLSTRSRPRPAWRCAASAWRRRCGARARGSSRPACQERRRLERNLHDGAQQRLVALSLTLRIAQNQIAKDPEKARRRWSARRRRS